MKVLKGDRVYIRPEFQDDGDAEIVFRAAEDSDGDRVLVRAELEELAIRPLSVISLDMLETEQR